MRKKTKWMSALLAVGLTLSLVLSACSGSGTGGNSNSKAAGSPSAKASDNSGNAASASPGNPDTSKFVTVNYVMLGNKPTNGQFEKVMAKVNALLKQKVNANLEIQWVEWADWQTKYNLLLASGQPLDLITIGTDWLDTWNNAQKGAFLPMSEDMLKKYAPETWQEIPQKDWADSKYKNQIVLIPEDRYTQWINHGFMYRGDWVKAAGITSPITDWETIGKYMQWIKDNKSGVIPFDVPVTNDNFFGFYVNSYTDSIDIPPIPSGMGPIFSAKSYDERYTVVSHVFDDTFLNFTKLMKQWSDSGYWRKDVLNYKGDNKKALEAGTTGVYEHHTQTYKGERVRMDKFQPGSELQFFPFGATRKNLVSMSITHGGTSIGAHSKNPERALMVYDLIRHDPEIYHLFNYGIEGVQYVIKDGVRTLPAGYNDANDSFYSDFWGGRNDKLEIPSDQDYSKIGDLYKQYDQYAKPYPYDHFIFDSTKVQAEVAAISQVYAQYMPAINFGKVADPQKAVESFRSKLKAAGFDKVMEEIQRQLDAFKKEDQAK